MLDKPPVLLHNKTLRSSVSWAACDYQKLFARHPHLETFARIKNSIIKTKRFERQIKTGRCVLVLH
jgi:hypothetical protein